MSKKNKPSKKNVSLKSIPVAPVWFRGFPTGIALFFIFALGFIVYSNTFDSEFQLDDETSITTNIKIQKLSNIGAIWHFWPTRFVTYLTIAVNWYIGKTLVFWYHAVNLMFHLLTTMCVYGLVLMLLRASALARDGLPSQARLIALFAALLFVAHPIQTQGVTYVTQRAVALAAFFYIATICCYAKSRFYESSDDGRGRRRWYALALVCAAIAMYTKENVITLPFAILMIDKMFLVGDKPLNWRRLIPFFLVTCLMPLTMAYTRTVDFAGMRRSNEPIPNITSYQYLVTQFRVLVTYMRLLLVPAHQNLDYDYPLYNSLFYAATFWSFIVHVVMLAGAWMLRSRARLISFGIFWFYLTLFPESGLLPIRDVIFEHRLYLPMIGYAIIVPVTLYYLLGRRDMRKMIAVFLALLAVYSVMTYRRNLVWKTQMSMWADSMKKAPNKSRSYKGLGFEYEKKGEYDKALAEYDRAIELNPWYDEVYYNRGNIYAMRHDLDRAINEFSRAIELKADYYMAYHNRSLAYAMKGMYNEALVDINKSIQFDPTYALAYCNRANIYCRLQRLDLAIADYTKAMELSEDYYDAVYNRGVTYSDMGEYDKAIADFDRALGLKPRSADAYSSRGFARFKKEDFEGALKDIDRAIELNPQHAAAFHNRGQVYGVMGQKERAIADFSKAIELDPSHAIAHRNRGYIYSLEEKWNEAIADYTKAIEFDGRYALAIFDRSVAYSKVGDFEKAMADVERLQAMGAAVDENYVKAIRANLKKR
jgi:tetratricopeptide (TPR) repeat protein